MPTHYQTLGVTEDASQAEIKSAFKRLALIYHPDKNQNDPAMEERFKEINHAYQVLSNPYEKARYDIQQKYGYQPPKYTYAEHTYSPPRPRYKREYADRKINWRENWIATAYAWGFTFIVAIIVMGIFGIKSYYDAVKKEELLAQRRIIFDNSRHLYASGNIDQSLSLLNSLGTFFEAEQDMEEYKDHVFDSILVNGYSSYQSNDYNNAIFYMELFEKYATLTPIVIKQQLATAYKITEQPLKSIKKLHELLIMDVRSLEVYMQLAEIYRDQLGDLNEARRFYEIADEMTVNGYRAIYGDGFPLVLTAEYVPKEHYTLYTNLADIYLKTGDPERAVKATKWNIRMWPDSVSNYLIAAQGHLAQGHQTEACNFFRKARKMGYREKLPITCY
ncbi:MAG: DnaJ domain-containing protein [Bacteroidota bacterium]